MSIKKYGKGMGMGWHLESRRHSLASFGVKTGRHKTDYALKEGKGILTVLPASKEVKHCNHRFVPDVNEIRKQNTGVWTCVGCGKHITTKEALDKRCHKIDYMMGASYPNKKDLKASIGKPLRYVETSLFGQEYKDNGDFVVVGPDAFTNRKWYAKVTVKDGMITRVV